MPIGGTKAVLLGSGTSSPPPAGEPAYSIMRGNTSQAYLATTTSAPGAGVSPDWSTFSYTTIGISRWFKVNAGKSCTFFSAGDGSIVAYLDTTGQINLNIEWTTTGTVALLSSSTNLDDDAWHHVYFLIDSTQATNTNRAKIYIDGVLESNYTGGNTCTQNEEINHGGGIFFPDWEDAPVIVYGAQIQINSAEANVYQMATFSGTLPAIGTIYTGTTPVPVDAISGLFSHADLSGGSIGNDSIISGLTWVSRGTGTLTTSADIPS